jgi:hypothetical protein
MPTALEIEIQERRRLFQNAGIPWENISTVFTDAYGGNQVAKNILERMVSDLKQGIPLGKCPLLAYVEGVQLTGSIQEAFLVRLFQALADPYHPAVEECRRSPLYSHNHSLIS